jgi:hypothetical protein
VRERPTVTIGSMLSSAVRRRHALEKGADDDDLTRTGAVGVASVLGRRREGEGESNCHYRIHAVVRCPPPSCARERG